jgi:hypothetical protein
VSESRITLGGGTYRSAVAARMIVAGRPYRAYVTPASGDIVALEPEGWDVRYDGRTVTLSP